MSGLGLFEPRMVPREREELYKERRYKVGVIATLKNDKGEIVHELYWGINIFRSDNGGLIGTPRKESRYVKELFYEMFRKW